MKILVDPQYNPQFASSITSATKLGPGISMAKFLGSKGSRTQLKKLYSKSFFGGADYKQIARNLVLHTHAILSISGNLAFANHRLIVSEGIYEPSPRFITQETNAGSETAAKALAKSIDGASYGQKDGKWIITYPQYIGEQPSGNSINALKRTGRAVVYQLIDKNGKIDHQKTFDLAVFWKDYINYDKLILDYDTFDPNDELAAQIVLVMPEVPEDYDVSFSFDVETTYNGELQAKNELLEILPD
jgi:hypothetical protein